MQLPTAKNYLLLTETIARKPMLRTRFTAQAYFVLAALFDLINPGVLKIGGAIEIVDNAKYADLPQYLDSLKKRINAEIKKGAQTKDALDLITSWDIANDIYDGIGSELLADQRVEKVPFKNNLDTHIIYVPTDAAREQVTRYLRDQMQASAVDQGAISLVVIMEQLGALRWLFPDKGELSKLVVAFHRTVGDNAEYAGESRLAERAAKLITDKKFRMDSWLS